MSRVVYFSKMFQAVPHLAQVANVLPGTFISSRNSTLMAVNKLYPDIKTANYSKWLGWFTAGNQQLKNADVIVTGSPYRDFLRAYDAKKCTVFHGTYMLLSKEALMSNAHFDLLCVIGPRMQQMINRFSDEVALKTEPTGFLPFCEFPEQTEKRRAEVLANVGLCPEQKTIIYTPSRRGVGSWNFLAETLIRKLPLHYNLILRPHPSQSLTARAKDRNSFKSVAELIKSRPNTVLDLTSQPLPLLLSVADLVISDANSPAEESLFYDVPQLLIETPQFSRDTLINMGIEQQMHHEDMDQLLTIYELGPSVFIDTPDAALDIAQHVEGALQKASHYSSKRQAYFAWVFGERDRTANERVAGAIKKLLL